MHDRKLTIDNQSFKKNEEAERIFNDRLAAKYFEIWDEYPIQRFTTEREGQVLSEDVPPGSRVLVVGSGGGRELPYLLALDCDIVAIDVSPEMLRIGQDRFSDSTVEWRLGNANELEFSENSFDAIVALGGVVNYLLNLEDFACEAVRLLRPCGVLILDSFNSEFIGESPAASIGARQRTPYSLSRLENAFLEGGFAKVETVGLRFLVDLLPPAANAERSHPARAGLLKILEGEAALHDLLPARSAKLLLMTARMPS